MLGEQPLELLAGVLAALVGMMQQGAGGATSLPPPCVGLCDHIATIFVEGRRINVEVMVDETVQVNQRGAGMGAKAGAMVDGGYDLYAESASELASAYVRAVQGPAKAPISSYVTKHRDERSLGRALGEKGFAFGARPLKGLSEMHAMGPRADEENRGLYHEQVFYKENGELRNVGYFKDVGLQSDPYFPGNIETYRFSPNYEGPLSILELFSMPGFRSDDYMFFTHNCQDYCDAVWVRFGEHN